MRFGTGPVFSYERIAASRRWQVYASRSFMAASLLAAMAVIAWNKAPLAAGASAREYARIGELYFYGLVGVELAIVMLTAPAAAAGAICLDRSRGTLDHMLVTDLSDAEIVLGKLGARLMPVLELIACSWPVLGICSLLGGIDPFALAMAFAIILAVAVLGCTLSMAMSVWARKPHEVIMVVYTAWTLVLVAYPIWLGIARGRSIPAPPRWVLLADPFYLAYIPYLEPNSVNWWYYAVFFASTLGLSFVLAGLSVWRMRPASVRAKSRTDRTSRLGLIGRMTRKLPAPSLDGNPVFWREWHRSRPSPWMLILVTMTLGMATLTCLLGSVALWLEGVEPNGGSPFKYAGVYCYVLLVPFGLLMLSAVAPMSLSEERQRGSLDVLMSTPLSTRTIVVGKWLGTFRLVPWLAIGPGMVTLALATGPHSPMTDPRHLTLLERLYGSALMVATILVHGAAITSFGLTLATWISRQSRAIAISVTLFVLIAVAWPFLVIVIKGQRMGPVVGGSALSPLAVAVYLLDGLSMRGSNFRGILWEATIWDACLFVTAIGLLELTVRTFDRRLGRISDSSRPIPEVAPKRKPEVDDELDVGDRTLVEPAGAARILINSNGTPSHTFVVDDRFESSREDDRRDS